MLLVVFDIDGTLADTKAVDEECFARALEEVFGLKGVTGATEAYRSSTDPGIAVEAFLARYGRPPSEAELTRMRERFVQLLAERVEKEPTRFQPVPGAGEVLRRLGDEPDVALAIATGSWEASGRLKLRASGLDEADIPAAFADGTPRREDILREAIAQAEERWGPVGRVVYVADGPWDVEAARAVGVCFLGVAGTVAAAESLRSAGAVLVVPDFRNWSAFRRALDLAVPPRG